MQAMYLHWPREATLTSHEAPILRNSAFLFLPALAWWPILLVIVLGALSSPAPAQSPEIEMRELSSTQIKKGVGAIGFGGDGATWGNYARIWHEADTVPADYGESQFDDGNRFHFEAVGLTSPSTWHHLTFYGITMVQHGSTIQVNLQSPGLGSSAVPVTGYGADLGIFGKVAMPLWRNLSIGILISHETSHFYAVTDAAPGQSIHYDTVWRPSGGLGMIWQPNHRFFLGAREMVNNDMEFRTDPSGTFHGEVRSSEFRLGGTFSPWKGAWLDMGGTNLIRSDALARTQSHFYHPNLGFEQQLLQQQLTLRGGLDETSPTAGATLKVKRFQVDSAYVKDMARSRIGNFFGPSSSSVLLTLTYKYRTQNGE